MAIHLNAFAMEIVRKKKTEAEDFRLTIIVEGASSTLDIITYRNFDVQQTDFMNGNSVETVSTSTS